MTSSDLRTASASMAVSSEPGAEWWRKAVIYQIYPRSFADANGDGMGDLPGITSRMGHLAELGVDAIWLSPFMTSPQKDAGYDVADYCDVDPLFGTLGDFDTMLETAHGLGIRVIVDLVPNHSSDQHRWFQEALKAAPQSPERARYIFRDGLGENGDEPPNNWQSIFGGRAWTRTTAADGRPGQWYLHLFDSSQPDFNWANPEIWEEFRRVLRFWLDRGVDGFRVDVAHALVKDPDLPDYTPEPDAASMGGDTVPSPYFEQPGVHDVYRDWRALLDEYPGDRALCGEAWVSTLKDTALWVRSDEMHQTFNFHFLETPWDAESLTAVIDDSIEAFTSVGAPSTWVLSNHDVVRHPTRLTLPDGVVQGTGIGPETPGIPDHERALRRGRAATALMLALPGSAYLYQGEELGLDEVHDLPDHVRQDPTWSRTNGERYGRDGCRVPLPWESEAPGFGFGSARPWLPQPQRWAHFAHERQDEATSSTLHLYREMLTSRRQHELGAGSLTWISGYPEGIVSFQNGHVTVLANVSADPVQLPANAHVLLSSAPLIGGQLEADTTVWFTHDTRK